MSLGTILLYGGLFSIFLILLRLVWTFPGAYVSYFIRKRLLHQNDKRPGPRQIFVVGWTGMRGVLALAAAMSLPQTIEDGSPFPHRDLIVFLTFCVILVTLVFQGLTLPVLIRMLGLAEPSGPKREEQEARRLVLRSCPGASRRYPPKRSPPDLPRSTTTWRNIISIVWRVSW